MATYAKLKNGDWGVRVQGVTTVGATVQVTKRDGSSKTETIAKVLFANFSQLSDVRRAVLCNMAFNLGQPRLAGFKRLRDAVESGAFDAAAAEMTNSKWSEQVGIRAKRLAKQMQEG